MDFTDLPQEILEEVFIQSAAIGVCRFSECCKYFNEIAHEQSLWVRMVRRYMPFVIGARPDPEDARAFFIFNSTRRGNLFGFGDDSSHRMVVDTGYAQSLPLLLLETDQAFDLISAGWWHCAFAQSMPVNRVWIAGQVGDNSFDHHPEEMSFPSTSPIVRMSSDEYHTIFLTEDSQVFGIGSKGGCKNSNEIAMLKHTEGLQIADAACMGVATLLVLADGTPMLVDNDGVLPLTISDWKDGRAARCFRGQTHGVLLSHNNELAFVTPGQDPPLQAKILVPSSSLPRSPIRTVALGCSEHNCAVLCENGQLYSFLGKGSDDMLYSELEFECVLEDCMDVAAGNGHVIACTRDGSVYTWGDPYRYETR
eukprot:TRINITY_DN5343_c0_g1_i1.p1 TRINITY_DN5343_c0_g1~~TRINITY_DN5343_c0_g1_i1.p1  ORF type:complete len:366 (+),score=48.38 TRINITY_DN5343_c0_g1_i1:49-1146(+)